MAIRVATFNVENLFARFRFGSGVDPDEANKDGWTVDRTVFHPLSMTDKALTGAAVQEIDADILCLQEVENVDTLKHFRARSLGGRARYPHVAGIDGNDPRLIDVAVLSRQRILHVRSYQHLPDPDRPSGTLFSRDCLEVDVEWPGPGQVLTLFVQHFKSMMGGRAETAPRRRTQARAVRQIVEARFGADPGDHPFIVCGDLNDYMETDDQGEPAIDDLVTWDQVVNVVDRLPEDERWSHYYKSRRHYTQLDYLLLSRSLAAANPDPPEIMRKGLPLRADRYTGPRFNGVGLDHPKASDHCPVVMTLHAPD
ncbi:endonuclease/exonuclease/phosphatase family protein [Actinocorallia populi]|uniref:endonuclease/exonuclease/phosphatase family protein n=1 Tax=Actinocorallia populi TaxID=2079200 RepID=UPI000D08DB90|nr:endonuclease/exonuclease/phosphatase family protein [Actinocorallia populi]